MQLRISIVVENELSRSSAEEFALVTKESDIVRIAKGLAFVFCHAMVYRSCSFHFPHTIPQRFAHCLPRNREIVFNKIHLYWKDVTIVGNFMYLCIFGSVYEQVEIGRRNNQHWWNLGGDPEGRGSSHRNDNVPKRRFLLGRSDVPTRMSFNLIKLISSRDDQIIKVRIDRIRIKSDQIDQIRSGSIKQYIASPMGNTSRVLDFGFR